jgi:hypothetical protein
VWQWAEESSHCGWAGAAPGIDKINLGFLYPFLLNTELVLKPRKIAIGIRKI